MGGDLLPHGYYTGREEEDFICDVLWTGFRELQKELGEGYPRVFIILGNDDPRVNEARIHALGEDYGVWEYIHHRKVQHGDYDIYGYSFIPPSPFGLKDWEKYDVSRFVDPGCTHPGEGMRSVAPDYDLEYSNIQLDLQGLTDGACLERAVFLFHAPPYQTSLDRAALDGQMIDYVPLDVHVGSIAIQRFIEARQPLLTLHGHVHEAARMTGRWREKMGSTHLFNAAVEEKQFALVYFDLDDLQNARRQVIPTS